MAIPAEQFHDHEIILSNSVVGAARFRLQGEMQPRLLTQFPPRLTQGEYSRVSDPLLSSLSLASWHGGWLRERYLAGTEPIAAWLNTADSRVQNQLTLPPEVSTTWTGVGALTFAEAFVPYAFTQYALMNDAGDRRIYKNDGGSAWSLVGPASSLGVSPAVDACAGPVNDVLYAFWACQDGYVRYPLLGTVTPVAGNGTTIPNPTLCVAFDQAIWVMDVNGKMWKMTGVGSPDTWDTTQGTLHAGISAPSAQALVVFDDANNVPRIHAVGWDRLWVYNEDDKVFYPTTLTWTAYNPSQPRGRTACVWRSNLYIGIRQTVYAYSPGGVDNLGFDRIDGLPTAYADERIVALYNGDNWLLALTDRTLWAWDGTAWHYLAPNVGYGGGTTGFRHAIASVVTGGNFEVWLGGDIAANPPMSHLDLQVGTFNPLRSTTTKFAATSKTITPWFSAAWDEVPKLWSHIMLEGKQITATETVVVSYQLNTGADDSGWTALTTLNNTTGNGPVRVDFNSGEGLDSYRIRFLIELARGTDHSKTPVLLYLVLGYQPLIEERYSISFTVDMREAYDNRTPAEQRAILQQFVSSHRKTQMRYTRNGEELSNRWGRISRQDGRLGTGVDTRSQWDLSMVEL